MIQRWMYALLMGAFLSANSLPANSEDAVLILKEVSGNVNVTYAGHEQPGRIGLQFSPPAQIRTGADGSVLVAQADTTIRINPNSVIAIPASATPSTMVDQIVQQLGNAMYNVKSRKGRPFSVQTPYLTSVVKGTLFSVTVQEREATVALLEGSLQVSGMQTGDTVMLKGGDTASLKSGEHAISINRSTNVPVSSLKSSNKNSARLEPDSGDTPSAVRSIGEDLAQITAGFAPASSKARPPVQPPTSSPPGTPPPVTPPPLTPPPVTPPPVTPPPVTPPPVTPPPVTPPPVTPPPVTPPPVTPPPVTPPPVTPPPVTPPPGNGDNNGNGNGDNNGNGNGDNNGNGNGDNNGNGNGHCNGQHGNCQGHGHGGQSPHW
jgi:hypothetical protein